MFDQAAVGIAISELDGRLAEVNRKFVQILGYPAEELMRRTAYEISHPDDVPTTRANVARLVAGEIPEYSYEKRYIHRDGSIVWTLTSVALLRHPDGRPRQFVGVIEDITALKEAQRAEREARAEAERMSALKDEFLATLSHELRTPLSAILGWAQVMKSRPLPPEEYPRAVEIIERNARAQARLIEDLLDMSRITSGKVRLDVQPVEPASLVAAALEAVRPAADAKSIALEAELEPQAGPVSGDPGRLQQVLFNLLTNAIKFTPQRGRVKVALRRVRSHLEVAIADTGIGIRPDFLPYVFDRFRQADASTTRRHGGLGIGLSIARHLVELHGGSLRVESAGEGCGSTFTMALPIGAVRAAPASRPGQPAEQPAAPARPVLLPDLSGVVVLAVDDEPDARELIRKVLADCGARVVSAAGAAEALALFERERPHVLLSDVGMPDIDGYGLLSRLRALGAERGGTGPAIALTAFARAEDHAKALQAGFRLHLAKPVEPEALCIAVAEAAGRALPGA